MVRRYIHQWRSERSSVAVQAVLSNHLRGIHHGNCYVVSLLQPSCGSSWIDCVLACGRVLSGGDVPSAEKYRASDDQVHRSSTLLLGYLLRDGVRLNWISARPNSSKAFSVKIKTSSPME